MIAPRLFTWLQGADFYHRLHQEAVTTLPPNDGSRQWIDVGCGPGLLARLAAAHGYRALGIDVNPHMIRVATQIAVREGSAATFQVGTIAALPEATADVVSAASLLAVLPDPLRGLLALWRGVRPGGALLIIEPTAAMTMANARACIRQGLSGRRIAGLYLWASARQGRAVDPSIYDQLGAAQRHYLSLLQGLVGAWILHRS